MNVTVSDKHTNLLIAAATRILESDVSEFMKARQLARLLGAHYATDSGIGYFGFWTPEREEEGIDYRLELLRPVADIDLQKQEQLIEFEQHHFAPVPTGDFLWLALSGLRAGSRTNVGDFYWLVSPGDIDHRETMPDPLAYSLPFGGYAPAELYDIRTMQSERRDKHYFQECLDTTLDSDGIPRVEGPANMLEVHVNTATAEGTLAALTSLYEEISRKNRLGEPLTSLEMTYSGYDSVQLMPVEPCIVHEARPRFFWEFSATTNESTLSFVLRQPDTTNWGYDVLIAGAPAINPVVLDSKRPDELIDFIAALHNFHGSEGARPIKVVLDIVYGHADNQSLPILNQYYFAGANMYGQNLRYRHPVVRAILLEMQRRKSNYGFDGLRVDGAQDFKYWVPETDELLHDDDYLILMNNLVQNVAGTLYRPWMIFEDGRPWPRDDWELASTYREVTRIQSNVVQWGPLTFAHNTPFLFTFWIRKWWRVQEMMQHGSHWLTGSANHDTLRRGTQVDPESRVNTYLGETLPDIFRKAYDNPAALLFGYVAAPGIPMDFLQANMRAPWSFMRNSDDRYGVKVVSEEAAFLDWAVNAELFARKDSFVRLKRLGLDRYEQLRGFMRSLDNAVQMSNYDLAQIATLMNQMGHLSEVMDVNWLKRMARAWMDDIHDYCNVALWREAIDPVQVEYAYRLRLFRRARPYLRDNLGVNDYFAYREPTAGSILFYGMRQDPAGDEQLLFIANMEGAACELIPTELPIPGLVASGWHLALAAPGVRVGAAAETLSLADSQGVLFKRRR